MMRNILIYRTPIRKRIEGIMLIFLAIVLFTYWSSLGSPLDFLGYGLFIISSFIGLFGLHRALSFQTTRLEKDSKVIKQLKLHFGFIKKQREYEMDNVTVFANDLYAFTWAVFAYKGDMEAREVMPEDRLIIIDAISGKRAKGICKEIDKLCLINYRSSKG